MLTGKDTGRIRRDRIDRLFVGTHFQKVQGRESWFEAGHFLKGMTYEAQRITETNGDGQDVGNCGFLVTITGEPIQNTEQDFEFYDGVLNGIRNVAIVTGKEGAMLLRIFRLAYIGSGRWLDNRISLVTSDAYNNQIDKGTMKGSGYITAYERYTIGAISIQSGKLTFTKTDGGVIYGIPTDVTASAINTTNKG